MNRVGLPLRLHRRRMIAERKPPAVARGDDLGEDGEPGLEPDPVEQF